MNEQVDLWLAFSKALFHELKPKDAGLEICGDGMPEYEFAALVDRELSRVDDALVSMSLAAGEKEVHEIFNALSRDTVIALFSRWAHYTGAWTKMLHEDSSPLWMPPDQKDLWRVILLAMCSDRKAQRAAYKHLWPGEF